MTEYRSNDRGDRNDRNDRGGDRGERGGNRNRRFVSRPKFCQFCSDKKLAIDYKPEEVAALKRTIGFNEQILRSSVVRVD